MAFARSASGPAGLSINTGAANLLWVPSLSVFNLLLILFPSVSVSLIILAASLSLACTLCLYFSGSAHLVLYTTRVHSL